MTQLSLYFLLTFMFLGGSLSRNAHGKDVSAGQYVVVAMAADTQSAVIRDPSGIPHLLRVGDLLAEGHWRLLSVSADALKLRAVEGLRGEVVELQLHEGNDFDSTTLDASLSDARDPVFRAERMIQRKPVASPSKRD